MSWVAGRRSECVPDSRASYTHGRFTGRSCDSTVLCRPVFILPSPATDTSPRSLGCFWWSRWPTVCRCRSSCRSGARLRCCTRGGGAPPRGCWGGACRSYGSGWARGRCGCTWVLPSADGVMRWGLRSFDRSDWRFRPRRDPWTWEVGSRIELPPWGSRRNGSLARPTARSAETRTSSRTGVGMRPGRPAFLVCWNESRVRSGRSRAVRSLRIQSDHRQSNGLAILPVRALATRSALSEVSSTAGVGV
jgi:hypothetical protein